MQERVGGGYTAVLVAMVVVSVVFVGLPVVGDAAASDNEAPLADAGLDQNVTANTTVHLDATGSQDPDGEIDDYEWRLERPDGNYTSPDCRSCGRTSFVARQTGTYNATITVTDDDGATATDTLRVRVSESNGPSVSLSGPESVVEGRVAEYSASVSAGESELAAVRWQFDGRTVNRTPVGGESASVDHWQLFSDDGNYTVRVTVVDELGRERTNSTRVTVDEPSSGDDSDSTASASGGSDDSGRKCSRYGRDDDRYCNNDRATIDSNGIAISDVDDDGSVEWAGVEIDEEFADANAGLSYDSTDDMAEFENKSAYKEALGVNTVNVNPEATVNQKQNNEERTEFERNSNPFNSDSTVVITDFVQFSGSTGSTGQNGENNDNTQADTNNDENSDSKNTNTRTGRVPPGRSSTDVM